VGNRKRRQPAHQPPARTKAPVAPHSPKGAKHPEPAAGKATGGKPGRPPTRGTGTKKAQVLALLRRTQGATLAELVEATGWQAHSVRGFLSGAVGKKMGLEAEIRQAR
jgi:hypothetical protein